MNPRDCLPGRAAKKERGQALASQWNNSPAQRLKPLLKVTLHFTFILKHLAPNESMVPSILKQQQRAQNPTSFEFPYFVNTTKIFVILSINVTHSLIIFY
jgi:hypothetical protein